MDSALTYKEYYNLGKESFQTQWFNLPQKSGTICAFTHFGVKYTDLLHYHDQPHLTLIFSGSVIDKRKTVETERLPGELMFFHSGEQHETINQALTTKCVNLTFNLDFLRQHSISETKLDCLITKNPGSKFNLLKIYKELLANDEFSDASIEMLLFNLTDEKRLFKNSIPNWVQKVKQLLNDNWNKEITLNDLATNVSVHPKSVSRHFPKYFACTLGEYRRQLKIEKAISLIKNSKLTLTEIAHECNFADQSHFIRTFKDLTGFLPRHFQKL